MKMIIFFFSMVLSAFLMAQSPEMDGNFDGINIWGSPRHTADQIAGWAGANSKKLYVTFDATYIYFGAEVTAATWMSWVFIINTKSGGGSADTWARAIDYAHTEKPDYIIRGHFDGYAERHVWNGSSWDGIGTGLSATEFGENITSGSPTDGWVEGRFPRSVLQELDGDIQFYITGDNNNHGSFDACPNDNNATQWDHSTSRIQLSNYATSVPLPIELVSFSISSSQNKVIISWSTSNELNNYGFEVQRTIKSENLYWENIGFVKGHGNSNSIKYYSFEDKVLNAGTYLYRLKQIDADGSISYSNVIEVDVNLIPAELSISNYPNPFNPATTIQFSVVKSGNYKVRLFDLNGQELNVLASGYFDTGKHQIIFDGTRLSSGMYITVLEGEGNFVRNRMMLIK